MSSVTPTNQGIPQLTEPPPLHPQSPVDSLASSLLGTPPPSISMGNDILFAHTNHTPQSSQSFISNDQQEQPNMVEMVAFEDMANDQNSVIEHSATTQQSGVGGSVEDGEEVSSHFRRLDGYYVYSKSQH